MIQFMVNDPFYIEEAYVRGRKMQQRMYKAGQIAAHLEMDYLLGVISNTLRSLKPNWKDSSAGKSDRKMRLPATHPLMVEYGDIQTMIQDFIQNDRADEAKYLCFRRDELYNKLIPEEERCWGF